MKHYTSIIKKYGITQWKRTLLTIIGIVLSVCLMSFSVIFIQNLKETIFHSAKYSTGYYHMAVLQPNEKQESVLRLYQKVKVAGEVTTKVVTLPNSNTRIQLMSFDEEARKIFSKNKLIEGELPIKENEIVLEKWIVEETGLNIGEELEVGGTQLKLVGVCKNQLNSKSNKSSLGYLIKNHPLFSSGTTMDILYIQFHEQYVKTQAGFELMVKELSEAAGVSEENVERNAIVYKAIGDYTDKDYSSILIIIINLLVMGLFIYNTFQISVMERIQHYGILRSLGATPRQVQYLVIKEAIIFSILAIPIGVGLGITLQGILRSLSFFKNAPKLTVPFQDMLWIGCIAFLTVLFSVYRPAVAASKVSPIQAIKMTQQLPKLKLIKREQPHFLLKSFGVSAHIAWQNILRNRPRFIGSTLSMSVAIVLVILNFGFFSSQDPAAFVKSNYLWNSNYYIFTEDGFKEDDIHELKQLFPKVEVITSQFENIEIKLNDNEFKEIRFYGYQEKELKKANGFIVEGDLNLDSLQSGKEILLVVHSKNPSTFKAGDSITLKAKDKLLPVKVGAILENYPATGDSNQIKIVGHTHLFESLTSIKGTYNRLDLTIKENAENHTEIYNRLDKFVEDGRVSSLYENIESIKEDFDVFQLLMLGFICIIGLIGLFSIYNTLVTSYLLRTNEFGILRAIGMTNSQLREMVIWEGLFYGLFSTVWGIIIGLFLHYLQYRILNYYIKGIYPSWDFPFGISILAGISCMIICIFTSILSSKRLNYKSVIESIKISD